MLNGNLNNNEFELNSKVHNLGIFTFVFFDEPRHILLGLLFV